MKKRTKALSARLVAAEGTQRFRVNSIPSLSAYAADVVAGLEEKPVMLSKLKPRGLTVVNPLRIAFEAPTEYLIEYVQAIARLDPERAANLSELIDVPVVKSLGNEKGYIVEKQKLSQYLLARASKIGEEAGRDLEKMIYEVKRK